MYKIRKPTFYYSIIFVFKFQLSQYFFSSFIRRAIHIHLKAFWKFIANNKFFCSRYSKTNKTSVP